MKAIVWFGGVYADVISRRHLPKSAEQREELLVNILECREWKYDCDTLPAQIHHLVVWAKNVPITNCVAMRQSNIKTALVFLIN